MTWSEARSCPSAGSPLWTSSRHSNRDAGQHAPSWARPYRSPPRSSAKGTTPRARPRWSSDPDGKKHTLPMPQEDWGTSLYEAVFMPTKEGMHSFRVEAWSDPVGSWIHAAEVKIHAGVDVAADARRGRGRPHARQGRGAPGRRRADAAHATRSPRSRTAPWRPRSGSQSALSPTRCAQTLAKAPLREWVTDIGRVPAARSAREGARLGLVRVLPAVRGRQAEQDDGRMDVGHVRHRRQAASRRSRTWVLTSST